MYWKTEEELQNERKENILALKAFGAGIIVVIGLFLAIDHAVYLANGGKEGKRLREELEAKKIEEERRLALADSVREAQERKASEERAVQEAKELQRRIELRMVQYEAYIRGKSQVRGCDPKHANAILYTDSLWAWVKDPYFQHETFPARSSRKKYPGWRTSIWYDNGETSWLHQNRGWTTMKLDGFPKSRDSVVHIVTMSPI